MVKQLTLLPSWMLLGVVAVLVLGLAGANVGHVLELPGRGILPQGIASTMWNSGRSVVEFRWSMFWDRR